jgi:hypothetical protein
VLKYVHVLYDGGGLLLITSALITEKFVCQYKHITIKLIYIDLYFCQLNIWYEIFNLVMKSEYKNKYKLIVSFF